MSTKGSGKQSPSPQLPGVWALEGEWSDDNHDVRSVRPMLEALSACEALTYKIRGIYDRGDLVKHLNVLANDRYDDFRFIYVALHGERGAVWAGDDKVRLKDLQGEVDPQALKGRFLHFGSCAVMRTDEEKLKDFRRQLGLAAVSGFTKNAPFVDSLAFEMLLFDAATWYLGDAPKIRNYLRDRAGGLYERLGFKIVTTRSSG